MNTDSQGNATYDFTVPSPGSIYVKAIVNENGKEIVNRGGSFWAPDKKGEWSDFEYRDYDEKAIKLVPDKKSYKAGRDGARARHAARRQSTPAGNHRAG